MKNLQIDRFIFLLLFIWGCVNQESSYEETAITVLSENEGEVFSPDIGGRTTMIKESPKTGSKNLSS